MQKLYQKLKKYKLKDAIRIEEADKQFIALKKLLTSPQPSPLEEKEQVELYLFLVIANSLICYQLSGKGEDYWEEFSEYFGSKKLDKNNLINELIIFLKQSKNNKRFINIKIKRIEKLKNFLIDFEGKGEFFYKNMNILLEQLSKIMNQKLDSKTIVFSVKMFGYMARNFFVFVEYPKEINIPIDSRLTNLFEKYKGNYTDINKFYFDLSEKLNIPMLHLDGIVWTLYDDLIKDEKM